MNTYGKNKSVVKRGIQPGDAGRVISRTVTIAHKAIGVSTTIDLSTPNTPPEMTANSFENAALIAPFFSVYRQNIKAWSTFKGDLIDYYDYTISGSIITLLNGLQTEPGEIFVFQLSLPNNVDIQTILQNQNNPDALQNLLDYGVANIPWTTSGLLPIILTILQTSVQQHKKNASPYSEITSSFTTALTGGSFSFRGGVLLPDGRVFCVPWGASNGKIYNPVTNTQFTTALTGGSSAFAGGVLLPDGRVFCVPQSASNGKIYDPVNDTQFTTALTSGVSNAFFGGVLLPDGRVFCVPRSATNGKIYDPATNTQFTTALTSGVSDAFFGGVLLPDGRVFCVPYNASNGKIYDPVTDTQFTTALTGGSAAFVGGVLLPDGRVFCVPSDASNGKIYDPVTNTQFTTALTGGSGAFFGGVLLPDGRVFCVPSGASNGKIYDPATNTQFTTALTGGSQAFNGGVLLPDGRVFCVPYNASNGRTLAGKWVKEINPKQFPLQVMLSAFLNKH